MYLQQIYLKSAYLKQNLKYLATNPALFVVATLSWCGVVCMMHKEQDVHWFPDHELRLLHHTTKHETWLHKPF